MPLPLAAAGVLLCVLAYAVAGCGRGEPERPVGPPPGVSVSLHQFRVDQVARRLLVGVHNDGPGAVHIRDLRLVSGSFEPIAPTRIEQALARTPRIDLPIPFGRARCSATAIPAVRPAAVLAHIRGGDGGTRLVRFPLPHPEPLLRDILTSECGTYILKQSIDVRFGPSWTPARSGDEEVLRGALVLTRTGRGRPVTITDMGANPHFNLRPAGTALPYAVPRGTGALHLPVEVTPARCDSHSFAEAKYAQRYGLSAEVGDGRRHRLPFESTGAVRTAFDDFARRVCDIPAG